MNKEIMYNSIFIIILVPLLLILIYLSVRSFNEKFSEYFGSDCINYITYEPTPKYEMKPNCIFVSIASYRDAECSVTVKGLFSKAQYPENIFLGICEQNKELHLEEKCDNGIDLIVQKYKDHIRYHNMPYTEARGPTFARFYCSKLWQGEQYFFQIDSHTYFEQNWDTNLIKMLEQCRYNEVVSPEHPYGSQGSKKPVLSAYPSTEEQMTQKGFPVMDNGKLTHNDMFMFLSGFWSSISDFPIRSPKQFIAAGFMFLESSFLYDVQYDPMLSHLFQGEEILFSARLFTNGYDVFAPNIKVCSHHYGRKGPMYYKDNTISADCRQKAETKVKFLLNLTDRKTVFDDFVKDIEKYGLGTFRTLQDFWNASGIIIQDNKIVSIESWSFGNKPSSRFEGWDFNISGYEKIKQWLI